MKLSTVLLVLLHASLAGLMLELHYYGAALLGTVAALMWIGYGITEAIKEIDCG
jgi:hypothetical protein